MAFQKDYQIVIDFLLPDDVVAKNVFYWHQNSASPADDETLLADVELWLETMYGDIDGGIDNEIICTGGNVYVRNTTLNTWERVGEILPDITFTLTGEMVSHGVAFVLRAMTAFGKSIARKFIAGFPETVLTQSVFDSATLTAMASFALDWVTLFTDGTGEYRPGTWRTIANEFANFTGVTFLNVLNGYQRRRQPGAGE